MLGASLMWLSRMWVRCLWRSWWRRRFRGSRSRFRSLCGFVMRLWRLLTGLSRLRRMLMPRLLVLRIRLWLRSRLTGWLPSRRRLMLRGLRRRRRVVRLLLLVRHLMLRVVPCLRRRLLGRLPVQLGTLQGPRPRRLVAPRMLQRLRLLLLVVLRMRMWLVLPLWWRVQGRRLRLLGRRLRVMRRTVTRTAPSRRLIRSG